MVLLSVDYHNLKKGQRYEPLSEGLDYYKIKNNGHIIYLPKSFEGEPLKLPEEDEDELY